MTVPRAVTALWKAISALESQCVGRPGLRTSFALLAAALSALPALGVDGDFLSLERDLGVKPYTR
jgi:hypothetical protein